MAAAVLFEKSKSESTFPVKIIKRNVKRSTTLLISMRKLLVQSNLIGDDVG